MGSTLHYSLKSKVLPEGIPQALEVLLQVRISPHPCRKSPAVLAQCRDAHPAKLPADLCAFVGYPNSWEPRRLGFTVNSGALIII